jgi:hypothetical protein
MFGLGSFAFAAPWLLLALAGLPIIWWLLRVTPPAPRRVPFPAIRLLLGLVPKEETPARTPLWLILLRTVLAAMVILGVAHPLLNPQPRLPSQVPIVLVVDDGWAAARDWSERQQAAEKLLGQAEREGREVILLMTAPPAATPLRPMRAADARAAVQSQRPKPWPVDRAAALKRLEALSPAQGTTAIWISDGIDADPKATAALARYLDGHGSLRYLAADPKQAPLLVAPGDAAAKDLEVTLQSLAVPGPRRIEVRASGDDGALLARRAATIAAGATHVGVSLPMPSELRNRVTRIEVEGEQSAGAVLLVDERWRRRPVGIAAPPSPEGQSLLSQTYYLERALGPFAEVRRGSSGELLRRDLAVLVFPDTAPDPAAEAGAVERWVSAGGLLLRFAGPHLAAEQDDKLLPVRLRRGGRTIGGALSWERPAKLAAFGPDSPFAGLAIPDDVTVTRQVLAEPDLDLAQKTWARLADGTPLVTGEKHGKGWIVLVHTTANADWSNLALSGLFVQMLRRIVGLSQGVAVVGEGPLPPVLTLDGFGRLERAPSTARPVAGKDIATATASPTHPPGFYGTVDARRALNLANGIPAPAPIAGLPAGTITGGLATNREVDLRPPLFAAALLLLLADLLIAYALRGLLWRHPARVAATALIAAFVVLPRARADDADALRATERFHLAYVETGNDEVDAESRSGLVGLTAVVNQRTAIEAADPTAIDIEKDELTFFPLLYWPVTGDEPVPSPQAAARLNRYLETGGTILFDTRDGEDDSRDIATTRLRRLTAGLKMPPLVPIPPDHVLGKSFYLLHDYPGRWDGGTLWVEPVEDHVNDGVSSVIVGGDDWAGAWAIDGQGRPIYAVVPGGERQREMAYRFGINLVMYVLTGNYKADQVHVPAILERLGE